MTAADWLKKNFESALALPPDAVDLLLMIWQVFQFFDDVADGDYSDRQELNSSLWSCMVGIEQNSFYIQHGWQLRPIVGLAIMKWQASDKAEREGAHTAMSYAWRAGYYDIVLAAFQIAHGPDKAAQNADLVMRLYGESFEEYMKEFDNA